ncbi:hypothetical protein NL676_022797 [Syzygium grande]|nr:hypothetical protein NL676_022797 [Syzygium grande]
MLRELSRNNHQLHSRGSNKSAKHTTSPTNPSSSNSPSELARPLNHWPNPSPATQSASVRCPSPAPPGSELCPPDPVLSVQTVPYTRAAATASRWRDIAHLLARLLRLTTKGSDRFRRRSQRDLGATTHIIAASTAAALLVVFVGEHQLVEPPFSVHPPGHGHHQPHTPPLPLGVVGLDHVLLLLLYLGQALWVRDRPTLHPVLHIEYVYARGSCVVGPHHYRGDVARQLGQDC